MHDDHRNMNKEYNKFQEWAELHGYEFPCTATEFHNLAAKYAAHNYELIECLCKHGIGQNWRD